MLSERELETVLSAVRRYVPRWKPRAQIYGTVEGTIAANQARALGDHQDPWALGMPSMIYPHCFVCSAIQGGIVSGLVREAR